MRFIWKIIQLELPQRDLEAILNTPAIHIFYISLRQFTSKTWTWVRLIFSRTKPWVGQFLKNRLFQGLNLKTHLEIGENKRFEAFMKVEIIKLSLVNAGRFWAGFGGLNHVVLSRIRRTYVNYSCNDFYSGKQWLLRFHNLKTLFNQYQILVELSWILVEF